MHPHAQNTVFSRIFNHLIFAHHSCTKVNRARKLMELRYNIGGEERQKSSEKVNETIKRVERRNLVTLFKNKKLIGDKFNN